MAVFGKFFVALWASSILVAAVPMNLARDVSMVTETAYTTVDVSVTLMVDENGVPYETVAPTNVAPVATTMATVTTPAASTATPSSAPAQSQQVSASPSVASPLASTTPVMVTTTPAAAAADAPVVASSSSVAAAAPASTSAASGGSTDASGISASATNMCTGKGDACSGDITHYDGGQSACGPIVDTNSQYAIALPYQFMGEKSNDNPYCGKSLTIHNPTTGLEIQAIVQDKCMGCSGRSIDLTVAAFNAIAPTCDGRCSNFIWWFN